MTQQALNSIELYKGNNPSTIEKALKIQKSSVVQELMEHYQAKDIPELALKLACW